MKIDGKRFLVAGLGRSGIGVARFLQNRGADVTVADAAGPESLGRFFDMARQMDIGLALEDAADAAFEEAEHIIISPGVPRTIAPIENAMKRGVPVTGEIELASLFIKEPMIAVTGTNGKTTVVTLIGRMLEESGLRVHVGGNIGNPLIDYAGSHDRCDIVVAEISSFQLDSVQTFRPQVGVMLNISEDHLDRYPDFKAYAESKWGLFQNQGLGDFAVLNGRDPQTRKGVDRTRARRLIFGDGTHPSEAAAIKEGEIVFKALPKGMAELNGARIDLSGTRLVGRHNHENIAASCLAAAAAGGSLAGILSALRQFKGLAHRMEWIASIDGADYYNDSKATNVDAVVKALESLDRPVILIMGGRDKESDFNLIRPGARQKVKQLILIGEAGEKMESLFKDEFFTQRADSMEEAVLLASQGARPGDAVLLSPACASFDMYASYADRGERFVLAVTAIRDRGKQIE